jgi:hypothetical protein
MCVEDGKRECVCARARVCVRVVHGMGESAQRHRDTETRRHRDTGTQRDTETQTLDRRALNTETHVSSSSHECMP